MSGKPICTQCDEKDCHYLVYDTEGIWCYSEYINDFKCPFGAKPTEEGAICL